MAFRRKHLSSNYLSIIFHYSLIYGTCLDPVNITWNHSAIKQQIKSITYDIQFKNKVKEYQVIVQCELFQSYISDDLRFENENKCISEDSTCVLIKQNEVF